MHRPKLECEMCKGKFTLPQPHTGRIPLYCPQCRINRKSWQSRFNMRKVRERRRAAAVAGDQ